MTVERNFATRLTSSAARLFELIDRFAQARILVVGDLTLDEFLSGPVERISREAPVLIIRHEQTHQVPGGGANAVYNFAALGAQVSAIGLVGQDDQGKVLREMLATAGVATEGILLDPQRPTVTKSRISGYARQSVMQQIVRLDRRSDRLPDPALQQQVAAVIRQHLSEVDAVVCSDYGDGVLMLDAIAAALSHPRVVVDTQKDLPRYRGATLFTPNLPEAERAVGYRIENAATLSQAGQDLLALTAAQGILITRGEAGMSLFERSKTESAETDPTGTAPTENEPPGTQIAGTQSIGIETHIPAFNKTEVFDVTGAGDTVVAALTLGLAAGASLWEAAVLGNLAASLVVRQFGTSTTTTDAMREALKALLEGEYS